MTEITKPINGHGYAIVTPVHDTSFQSLSEDIIKSLYETYGAILFRGFDFDVEIFKEMTNRFCIGSIYNESNGRKVIDKAANIQSVNLGVEAFPFHPELSREPWKPDVCWFACIDPPASGGGETTLCDGIAVVKELPANVKKVLSNKRLLYTRSATNNDCRFWLNSTNITDKVLSNTPEHCPFEFHIHNSKIYRSFTVPALHKPMFSDSLAFGNFLLFARRLGINYPTFSDGTKNGSIVPEELLYPIDKTCNKLKIEHVWQKNDLLMLDNTRYMHGRNRITNTSERLIVSYFGYLNFAKPNKEEPINALWRNAAGLSDLSDYLKSE